MRKTARQRKKERFTALLHHVDFDLLLTAFFWVRRNAAAGVDGVTWADYEDGLEERLKDLHRRIHGNAYRAQPSRRQYIPKADGKLRPLGIAALEDKIVQRALVEVLNYLTMNAKLAYVPQKSGYIFCPAPRTPTPASFNNLGSTFPPRMIEDGMRYNIVY